MISTSLEIRSSLGTDWNAWLRKLGAYASQWRREGFWRPGAIVVFVAPSRWASIERPFLIDSFASFSALNLSIHSPLSLYEVHESMNKITEDP
jgi:hypothetical protein